MRANTIVLLSAAAVGVIGCALAFHVGALHAIVAGVHERYAPSPASHSAVAPSRTSNVVSLGDSEQQIALPYFVIRRTSEDPVLVQQTATLKAKGGAAIWRQAHTALKALDEFPRSGGELQNPLPEGAHVLGVQVDLNGIATVNLSRQFRANFNGGAREEQVTLYAIVNTVGAIKGVNGVRFAIDGQPLDEFAGHIDLSSPLTPDLSLAEKSR